MRFGAPIYNYADPDSWVAAVRAKGYRAAYCPIKLGASQAEIAAYARAAGEADIVIAEVGAWGNNPLHPDPAVRKASLEGSKAALAFADEIGARCCVNVAGSRGERWSGPHDDNLTEETFEMIVAVCREILDDVRPRQAKWALEDMPYMYPDSAENYLRLLAAVDRPMFGVHFDPVNLVNSPQRYYNNGAMIRDFVRQLGPHIGSCHVKDIILREGLTVHLDETPAGTGHLDYVTYIQEVNRLDPDTPFLLEHLHNEGEYDLAAAHIRSVAQGLGITL